MHSQKRAPLAALAALLLALAACSAPGPTAPTGENGPSATPDDRQRSYAEAAALQQALRSRGLILGDAGVNAYVAGVVRRLAVAAPDRRPAIRAYVLKSPLVNAMALPNGDIYFNSGLIATLENEAQLAAIAAHEISHAWSEHGLDARARSKDVITAANIADILLLGLARVGAAASLAGYSRAQEQEADLDGLALVHAAGYEVTQFADAYELMAGLPEYAMERGSVFSSHPEQLQRVAYLREAIDRDYAAARARGEVGREAYGPVRREQLQLSIQLRLQARLPAMALDMLTRGEALLASPALAAYYRGEAARCMAEYPREAARERSLIAHGRVSDRYVEQMREQVPAHFQEAIASYRRTLTLDPALRAADRGLGLALLATGDSEAARPHLARYLAQSTPPEDARYIQRLLDDMQGNKP